MKKRSIELDDGMFFKIRPKHKKIDLCLYTADSDGYEAYVGFTIPMVDFEASLASEGFDVLVDVVDILNNYPR